MITVYRFAYDLYLPKTWSYGDESDALPGAQVWADERDVAFASVGGDCDGRYDDQPHVLVLEVSGCSGDDGGCDWPVILPGDLHSARRVATKKFASWVTKQAAAAFKTKRPSPEDVRRWAEDHRGVVASWLLANSKPVKVQWRQTLAIKQSADDYDDAIDAALEEGLL